MLLKVEISEDRSKYRRAEEYALRLYCKSLGRLLSMIEANSVYLWSCFRIWTTLSHCPVHAGRYREDWRAKGLWVADVVTIDIAYQWRIHTVVFELDPDKHICGRLSLEWHHNLGSDQWLTHQCSAEDDSHPKNQTPLLLPVQKTLREPTPGYVPFHPSIWNQTNATELFQHHCSVRTLLHRPNGGGWWSKLHQSVLC